MMDNFNRSSLYLDAPPCDSSTRSPYVTSMPRAGAVHLITIEPVENQRPHVGNTPIESPVPEVGGDISISGKVMRIPCSIASLSDSKLRLNALRRLIHPREQTFRVARRQVPEVPGTTVAITASTFFR